MIKKLNSSFLMFVFHRVDLIMRLFLFDDFRVAFFHIGNQFPSFYQKLLKSLLGLFQR